MTIPTSLFERKLAHETESKKLLNKCLSKWLFDSYEEHCREFMTSREYLFEALRVCADYEALLDREIHRGDQDPTVLAIHDLLTDSEDKLEDMLDSFIRRCLVETYSKLQDLVESGRCDDPEYNRLKRILNQPRIYAAYDRFVEEFKSLCKKITMSEDEYNEAFTNSEFTPNITELMRFYNSDDSYSMSLRYSRMKTIYNMPMMSSTIEAYKMCF